ncbi:MAG: periplasmic-type flagellar collar protein FlcA, partial [Spirochaetaceae bacterium]
MPSRNDLDLFNKTLVGLGNEPSVTARWGEEVETMPPGEAEEGPEPEQPEIDMGFGDLGADFETPEDFGEDVAEDADEFDLGDFAEESFGEPPAEIPDEPKEA